MAFTKIVGAGIHTLSNVHTHNINSSGIITATNFVGIFSGTDGDFSGNVTIDGNLTVNGNTTTLDTTLQEVDQLFVSANNTNYAGIITQTGTGNILGLFDGVTRVFNVADGGATSTGALTVTGDIEVVDSTPRIKITDSDATGNAYAFIDGQAGQLKLFADLGNNVSGSEIVFGVDSNTAKMVIKDTGAVLMGGTSSRDVGFAHKLQLEDTGNTPRAISIISNRGNQHASHIDFAKSRGGSLGSNTMVQDDDFLGHIIFRGADGTDLASGAAKITSAVDGTPASNDIPGRLEFHTSTGGTSYERLRINSSGNIGINQTEPAYKLVVNEETTVGTAHTVLSALNPIVYIDAGNEVDHNIVLKKHTTSNGDIIGGLLFASSPDGANYNWTGIKAIQDTNGAAESLVFYTSTSNTGAANSTEVVRIKGNNVGIGTDNPLQKLHLYGSGNQLIMLQSTSTGAAQLQLKTSQRTYNLENITGGTFQIRDGSVGSIRLSINSSGHTTFGGNLIIPDQIIHHGDTDTKIRFPAADNISFETGGDERLRIHADGKVTFGSSSVAKATVDIFQSGQSATSLSLLVGANESGGSPTTRTNNFNKAARIACPHYTNAEEPMNIVVPVSTSSENTLYWGGGTNVMNAATSHHFYTAANNTTPNGTERLHITSTGVLNVPAGIGPQLRFENQHSVTTDAVISTFDDASGTLLCLGSNFYINSSGAETRYNTSEESTGIILNRQGYINLNTGGTGTNARNRIQITETGKVQIGLPGNAVSLPGAVEVVNIRAMTDGNLCVRAIGSIASAPSGSGVGIDVLNDANNTVKDLALRGSTVIFKNASDETLRITSGGQVQITGSGSTPLKVTHTGADCAQFHRGSKYLGINADWGGNTGDSVITASDNLVIHTNGSNERLTINSSGNVAIANEHTSIPRKLWIYEGSNDPYVRIQRGSTSSVIMGGYEIASSNGNGNNVLSTMYTRATANSGTTGATIFQVRDQANNYEIVRLCSQAQGAVQGNRMLVNGNQVCVFGSPHGTSGTAARDGNTTTYNTVYEHSNSSYRTSDNGMFGGTFVVGGNASYWYPVWFQQPTNCPPQDIWINKYVHNYATWDGSLNFRATLCGSGYGAYTTQHRVHYYSSSSKSFIGKIIYTGHNNAYLVCWMKGGGRSYGWGTTGGNGITVNVGDDGNSHNLGPGNTAETYITNNLSIPQGYEQAMTTSGMHQQSDGF